VTPIAEAAALLAALAHRGIVLWADAGDSIHCRCRPGQLTAADRAAVDIHRPELVALLRARPIYQPGDRPPGLLRLVPHEHHCVACGQALRVHGAALCRAIDPVRLLPVGWTAGHERSRMTSPPRRPRPD
jgi:hypothetical protein